ncbi:MAG: hypothetical protein ABEJ57_07260 [Halobacteriaceae archaeon]
MILLVAEGGPAAVDAALAAHDVTRVATNAAAKDPDDRPLVVVLHRPSIPDADALVQWLRSDQSWDPRVPVVVIADSERPTDLPLRPYDAIVPDTDEDAIADAIDTAVAVAEYRGAVDALYERCLDRAEGGAGPLDIDPAVTEARDRADARLDALPEDPEVLAALLADPDKH